MALADFFGRYLGNQYSDNPAFPSAPKSLYSDIGREGIYRIARQLQTNPNLIDALSQGMLESRGIARQGMAGYAEALRKQQDQEQQMKLRELDMASKMQGMELAERGADRADAAFELDKTRAETEKLRYDLELKRWGLTEKETNLRIKKLENDEEQEQEKIRATLFAAESFGRTPEQKQILTQMANAGAYKEMWDMITRSAFPDPNRERWGLPENRPGIGWVQTNNFGSMRVLNQEDSAASQRPLKDESVINPNQISKNAITILTKELIPNYLREQVEKEKKRGFIDKLFGGEEEPTEPMTNYGGQVVPSRLIEESQNIAVQRYVSSAQKVRALREKTAGSSAVQSPSSAPTSGQPIKDFSSKLALDRAIKERINADPRYAGMPQEQKDQMAKQLFDQIKSQIEAGQGTYDEAVKQFSLPMPPQ